MAKAPAKQSKKKAFKKKEKKHIPVGVVHVQATFNNTIMTFTDPIGNVVAWSSSGSLGFRGSRKGTPFAAQQASLTAANKAREAGMRVGRSAGQRARAPAVNPPCARCPPRASKCARFATSRRFRTTAAVRQDAPRLISARLQFTRSTRLGISVLACLHSEAGRRPRHGRKLHLNRVSRRR